MTTLLKRFEAATVFREDEAWLLFKLSAFAEAGGWSLLIAGILSQRLIFHGSNIPVLLTGQVHGTIFLIYLLAATGLYPSLRWNRRRALLAVLASVPPYGSFMFEQWAAYQRQRAKIRLNLRLTAYQRLLSAPGDTPKVQADRFAEFPA